REHVRFVDDVDLVAVVARWRVHGALAELARIVHAAVGRGVDLDDVEAGCAAPDTHARGAYAAGLAVGAAVLAVERHREHARERGLADAARTAEEVAVRHPAASDRPLEGRRDVRLHG